MAHPETGGVRTTEDEGEELETPSDDEEIQIPSQDNDGIWKVDVRNEQLENTQREDWLLPTESRHGARPRQTGAEHPPEMEDSVFRDVVDISAVWHPNGTLRLSPGRRIDMALHLGAGRKRHVRCLGFFRRTLNERMVKVRRMSGRR